MSTVVSIRDKRLQRANDVAQAVFPYAVQLTLPRGWSGGISVEWTSYRGEQIAKRWLTMGQSFYPPWHRHWPGGGTSITALAQVVRFARSQPVLPLSWWIYITGGNAQLYSDRQTQIIAALERAEWPRVAVCVLCGKELQRYDWWSLDDASGPCCHWLEEGCRKVSK